MPVTTVPFTQQIARVVSYTINPLVLPPILLCGVVVLAGGSATQVWTVAGLSLVAFCLIPLGVMYMTIRGNPNATIELRDRAQRNVPYLVTAVCGVAAVLAMNWVDAPERTYLQWIVATIVLNGVLLMVINFFWKISLHTATLAGSLSILAYTLTQGPVAPTIPVVEPGSAMAIWASAGVAVGLMMWARVHNKAHSIAEVVGGAVFGLLLPFVELGILDALGAFR